MREDYRLSDFISLVKSRATQRVEAEVKLIFERLGSICGAMQIVGKASAGSRCQ